MTTYSQYRKAIIAAFNNAKLADDDIEHVTLWTGSITGLNWSESNRDGLRSLQVELP